MKVINIYLVTAWVHRPERRDRPLCHRWLVRLADHLKRAAHSRLLVTALGSMFVFRLRVNKTSSSYFRFHGAWHPPEFTSHRNYWIQLPLKSHWIILLKTCAAHILKVFEFERLQRPLQSWTFFGFLVGVHGPMSLSILELMAMAMNSGLFSPRLHLHSFAQDEIL